MGASSKIFNTFVILIYFTKMDSLCFGLRCGEKLTA